VPRASVPFRPPECRNDMAIAVPIAREKDIAIVERRWRRRDGAML
jgi:hypothetical protein